MAQSSLPHSIGIKWSDPSAYVLTVYAATRGVYCDEFSTHSDASQRVPAAIPPTMARARESAAVVRRTGARRHLLLARSAAETANGAVERMVLLGLTSRIIPKMVRARRRGGEMRPPRQQTPFSKPFKAASEGRCGRGRWGRGRQRTCRPDRACGPSPPTSRAAARACRRGRSR